RVFVTEQPGRRIVHLLAYIPELRGKTQVIDEPITITGAKLSLLQDEHIRLPRKAYLAPDAADELSMEFEDGYAMVKLPEFKGYAMVVFE
ncbi:MAG: hypothetical protein PHV59_12010, partial [Victivallales bacterium]|nr:hypothetical protein [Victivallales bacterium]